MIRCNLAVLLAERNLKITKVSKDTGISRTTLTALSNNYSQGIQFDTFNTLCMYLKIDPAQLISFVPVDIKITGVEIDRENMSMIINLTVTENNRTEQSFLISSLELQYEGAALMSLEGCIFLPHTNSTDVTDKENERLVRAFKKITRPFLMDIESTLIGEILLALNDETDPSIDLDSTFYWEESLRPPRTPQPMYPGL